MYRALFFIFMLATFVLTGQSELPLDTLFAPVKWRNIGPFRGGRSVATSGVKGDPLTYYMGITGGGLWKTNDAGQHWNNISDGYFKTGSVGAIAVSESNPNILYCGMGEHAPRGVMTSYGDGVYKSLDAGKTWHHMGLANTQHVSRIVIHPHDPNIVYVAAQGALYDKTKDRGIYKSTDGGKTWSNKLFINELTGCAELSIDMNHPHIMYAAMWHHQRLPWQVVSGGEGSGLYKSIDGGETWSQMKEGLPKEMGKMAIAVSRSNSDKVYALIESDSNKEQGGLFVSDNAGKKWSRISDDHRLIQRAWYYIEVFVDPQNEESIYVLSASAYRSDDGGKTWTGVEGQHGDYHDLWINPDNPKNMILADDGGACVSFDKGQTWSRQDNMPTAQFYRLNVDNHIPYRIYAGQQDNSSVRIDSRSFGSGGIDEKSWTSSAGGESAFLAFDPDNPRWVLGGSYQGTIEAYDSESAAGTSIMAAPIQYLGRDAKDMKYRYNWNAPIIRSQHEPNTYYHAAQLILKTLDYGQTWEEVSPDLTRNDKGKQGKGGVPYTNEAVGAENYGTISYVIESPHEAGVMWVGSDDGLVHLTRNNGKTWDNVTPTGLSECLINAIEISPHDPATAYIATTRYKFNDYTPALYKTTNYGKTWTNISKGIPIGAFTRVVREDPSRKDLLIAGTETGLYLSWNGGVQWNPFQLNLPITPITDILIKHGDIIVATSGRSFWILDDLGLISQAPQKAQKLSLYKPEEAILANGGSELNSSNPEFKGTHPLRGINPANGVVIYYQIPEGADTSTLTLQIQKLSGEVVRTYSSQKDMTTKKYNGSPPTSPVLTTHKGMNRIVWDMRHETLPGIPSAYIEGSFRGHKVAPGTYTAILRHGNAEERQNINILTHPKYNNTEAHYSEYDQVMTEMETSLRDMHTMVNELYATQTKLIEIAKRIKDTDKTMTTTVEAVVSEMDTWDKDMVQRLSKAYDDVENYPNKFTAEYLFLINQTESDIPKVNAASLARKKELDAQWQGLRTMGETLKKRLAELNIKLWQSGIGAIW